MTDPTRPAGHAFDALVAGRGHEEPDATARRTGHVVWPFLTGLLVLLGAGAIVVAALDPVAGPQGAGRQPAPAVSAPAAAVSALVSPAPSHDPGRTSSAGVGDSPIAELADPAWVRRIAAAGDVPERALAAYAGASLAVSRTRPGCHLGWNTLAAIGLVETEHGSMNGASVRPDGIVEPTIIGIALDGTSTAAVRDTDGGALDRDPVWDRAVGPMQFIPSTWAEAAQDGNRDGIEDIDQIDDAVLAAAVHLCEVGGDLARPENWIAAIGAYNPSADYNNRVAEAAERYAALR